MKRILTFLALLSLLASGMSPIALAQPINSDPPAEPVRLIFIHHSTGGNWLADPAQNELGGDLGRALMENNYYVSATNYGWGPDSIGDATDIPNWLDWFTGERSQVYLEALYAEGGQNFGDFGSWPRLADLPEGENRIIVFKSCFPNSDLEGRPDDPAAPDGWLTVANAKYTYNEILKYFAARPDKLFVVVTAPPLSQNTHAKNARAFNLWLVEDWLEENQYTLGNVAVFDFYNVLTGPENHHRVVDGQVEHTYQEGQNLSYYPSGDDHPSQAGNRKAAAEFVPLLNAFYHNWIAASGGEMPASQDGVNQPSPGQTEAEQGSPAAAGSAAGYSEGFEEGMQGWEAYNDGGGQTSLTCQVTEERAFAGSRSLQLDFDVAPEGWATCGVDFGDGMDWSSAAGLSFMVQSAALDAPLHVDLYAGGGDGRESYFYELAPDGSSAWRQVDIPWAEFKRVDWEENAGQPFGRAGQVSGIAFGMPSQGKGSLWVDDLHLLGSDGQVAAQQGASEEEAVGEEPEAQQEAPQSRFRLPFCSGAAALPLGAIVCTWLTRSRSGRRETKSQ